jgi:hypothetical protein
MNYIKEKKKQHIQIEFLENITFINIQLQYIRYL